MLAEESFRAVQGTRAIRTPIAIDKGTAKPIAREICENQSRPLDVCCPHHSSSSSASTRAVGNRADPLKLFSCPDEVHDALKALRSGLSPKDIQVSWNISPTTLHSLKHKYGDCPVQAIEQMEHLARENARLKQRVRYLQLDCAILQAGLEAQSLNSQERELIGSLSGD